MKKYCSPKITVVFLECEESIAAYSASVSVGGGNGNGTPVVEDWENEGQSGNHFFM